MKMCPFRKRYTALSWYYGADGSATPETTDEEFLECIGKECMSYYTYEAKPYWDAQFYNTYEECKLMTRREY